MPALATVRTKHCLQFRRLGNCRRAIYLAGVARAQLARRRAAAAAHAAQLSALSVCRF